MADTGNPPLRSGNTSIEALPLQVAEKMIAVLDDKLTTVRAELDAVRAGVNALISGTWMPTPAAIRSALYPSEGAVQAQMPEERE